MLVDACHGTLLADANDADLTHEFVSAQHAQPTSHPEAVVGANRDFDEALAGRDDEAFQLGRLGCSCALPIFGVVIIIAVIIAVIIIVIAVIAVIIAIALGALGTVAVSLTCLSFAARSAAQRLEEPTPLLFDPLAVRTTLPRLVAWTFKAFARTAKWTAPTAECTLTRPITRLFGSFARPVTGLFTFSSRPLTSAKSSGTKSTTAERTTKFGPRLGIVPTSTHFANFVAERFDFAAQFRNHAHQCFITGTGIAAGRTRVAARRAAKTAESAGRTAFARPFAVAKRGTKAPTWPIAIAGALAITRPVAFARTIAATNGRTKPFSRPVSLTGTIAAARCSLARPVASSRTITIARRSLTRSIAVTRTGAFAWSVAITGSIAFATFRLLTLFTVGERRSGEYATGSQPNHSRKRHRQHTQRPPAGGLSRGRKAQHVTNTIEQFHVVSSNCGGQQRTNSRRAATCHPF